MADLFAWLVKEEDGREGPVCAVLPGLGLVAVPLVSLDRRLMEAIKPVAQAHGDRSGKPVRFVRFTEAETLDRV
jgi:hypothetical protein